MTAEPTPLHVEARDEDAERDLLTSLLWSKDARDAVEATLTAEDFYKPAHAILWACLMGMHDAGRPVDARLVVDQLRKDGDLGRVGGPGYVLELTSSNVVPTSAGYYARIVRDAALLRVVQATGVRLAHLGTQPGTDPIEALEQAEKAIDSASNRLHGTDTVTDDWASGLEETIDRIDKGGSKGLPTGFRDLDHYCGGMRPGSLITVAALSSGGKSMMAENIALSLARAPRLLPVFVASLEMTRDEWQQRALAQVASVDLGRIIRGKLEPDDWDKIAQAQGPLSDMRIRVDDREDVSVPEIRAAARAWFRRHGPGLVVVDYLQMVRATAKHGTREREVAEIAHGLKSMAKALRVPVLALAQLNKESVQAKRRPTMHDLRESQAIAQYSDLVVLLHRNEDDGQRADVVEVGVGKNRHGPKGSLELQWQGHYARMVGPESQHWKGRALPVPGRGDLQVVD
jgi:replicative DNA helicase